MKGDKKLQKRKRQKQLYHRILFAALLFCALSRPILAKGNWKVENGGYWLDSETFVTEYTIPAVYGGNGRFLDIEGNRRDFPDKIHTKKLRKGRTYILYMSDNGTKDTGDDVVLGIE